MDPKLKRQMQTVDKKANIFGDVVRTLWFRGDENLDDKKYGGLNIYFVVTYMYTGFCSHSSDSIFASVAI